MRWIAVFGCLMFACAAEESEPGAPTIEARPGAPEPGPGTHIARTARLDLEVDAWQPFETGLNALVAKHGATVTGRDLRHVDGDVSSAELALAVPSGSLDALISELRSNHRVVGLHERAEDVTRAWVDGAARLANLNSAEARIREIIDERAGTLADVLEAERELTRVRGEIEQMDAEHRALTGRVANASVSIGVEVRQRWIAAPPPLTEEVVGALVDSTWAVGRFGRGSLVLAASMTPPLAALCAVILAVQALRGRRLRRAA
jgi:hypothetical protein